MVEMALTLLLANFRTNREYCIPSPIDIFLFRIDHPQLFAILCILFFDAALWSQAFGQIIIQALNSASKKFSNTLMVK